MQSPTPRDSLTMMTRARYPYLFVLCDEVIHPWFTGRWIRDAAAIARDIACRLMVANFPPCLSLSLSLLRPFKIFNLKPFDARITKETPRVECIREGRLRREQYHFDAAVERERRLDRAIDVAIERPISVPMYLPWERRRGAKNNTSAVMPQLPFDTTLRHYYVQITSRFDSIRYRGGRKALLACAR